MVIDSSAVLAILLKEPEEDHFLDKLDAADRKIMSAANALEASIAIERRAGSAGAEILARLLEDAGITIVPFDAGQFLVARDAWRRFGKGRHPAKLNFGDCIAYALSKATGLPLLFKGEDFARTDVVPA